MEADVFLDAAGLHCPLPVLRVKKALGELRAGQTLRVFATDPGAQQDIPAFAKMAGHALLKVAPSDDGCYFLLQKK